MAQKTWTDGEVLTASDITTYLTGEGGAWTAYTPTVDQAGAVTVTNTRSVYARWGRMIVVTINLTVTGGSATSSNQITISLPVTAAASGVIGIGGGVITDATTGESFRGVPFIPSTSSVGLSGSSSLTAGLLGAANMTAALASGDTILMGFIYEAAS